MPPETLKPHNTAEIGKRKRKEAAAYQLKGVALILEGDVVLLLLLPLTGDLDGVPDGHRLRVLLLSRLLLLLLLLLGLLVLTLWFAAVLGPSTAPAITAVDQPPRARSHRMFPKFLSRLGASLKHARPLQLVPVVFLSQY